MLKLPVHRSSLRRPPCKLAAPSFAPTSLFLILYLSHFVALLFPSPFKLESLYTNVDARRRENNRVCRNPCQRGPTRPNTSPRWQRRGRRRDHRFVLFTPTILSLILGFETDIKASGLPAKVGFFSGLFYVRVKGGKVPQRTKTAKYTRGDEFVASWNDTVKLYVFALL